MEWSCASCREEGRGDYNAVHPVHRCSAASRPRGSPTASGRLQHEPDRGFVNEPHPQLYGPGARGAGQARALHSLFRYKPDDGEPLHASEAPGCPPKTHVLVTSFGFYPPFNNLRDPQNPLVQLAESGVHVTAVNHWMYEAGVEEATAYAQDLGVAPHIVTRIGSFPVRRNFDLVHPPYQQHKPRAGGGWCVRGRSKGAAELAHPTELPRSERTYGCMHTKLVIVRWRDGTVRVAVTSGNLGESEWGFMAEVGHVQTFKPFQSGGQALGGTAQPPAAGPGGPRAGGAAAGASADTTTIFLTPSTGAAGDMLRQVLHRMQVLPETITALLAGANINDLAVGEFVNAQPGFHFRMPRQGAAEGGASGASATAALGKKRAAQQAVDLEDDDDMGGAEGGAELDGAAAGAGAATAKRMRAGAGSGRAGLTSPRHAVHDAFVAPDAAAPGLCRARAAQLARLSAQHLDLRRIGCAGHVALRALQRYGRLAVGALSRAASPWLRSSEAEALGESAAARPSGWSEERLRSLLATDGLLVQGSSMGQLQATTCVAWVASANGVDAASLPPAVERSIKEDFKPLDEARPAPRDAPPFVVVWPEQRVALRSTVVEMLGNLCWNVEGRAVRKVKMPRLYHYEGEPGREGLMPHAKMWLPFQLSLPSTPSRSAIPSPLAAPLLRRHRPWVVVGSANVSAAAWGRGGDAPDSACVIANWEMSYLLPNVYSLELPRAVATRVMWGAGCLQKGVEPEGLSPDERELADALCCFRTSLVAPAPHTYPIRVPPRPYEAGDMPWRGAEAAGPAYLAAVARSRSVMGGGAAASDPTDPDRDAMEQEGAGPSHPGAVDTGAPGGGDDDGFAAAWEDFELRQALAESCKAQEPQAGRAVGSAKAGAQAAEAYVVLDDDDDEQGASGLGGAAQVAGAVSVDLTVEDDDGIT